MSKWVSRLMVFPLMICSLSSLAEDTEMHYQQHKLPDGSIEVDYSQSDGSKVKQVQRPDGTIETLAIDSEGNETRTIQKPNGDIDMKTIPKKS